MRELWPNSLKTQRILTSRVTEAELQGTLGVSQVKFIIAERGQGQRDELDLVKITQLTQTKQLVRIQARNLPGAPGKPRDQMPFPRVLPLTWQRVGRRRFLPLKG